MSFRLHPELKCLLTQKVDIIKNEEEETDIWGNPIPATVLEDIPALWIDEVKIIAKDDNTKEVIVSYVTLYLPPDLEVTINDKVKFKGQEKPILQIQYPNGMNGLEEEFPLVAWL